MIASSAVERLLTRAWRRRGPIALALWPLSLITGAVIRSRRRRFADGRTPAMALPVPVVVVGNLYVGGTGKTPLIIWLAEVLRRAGYSPGVVSRGYGGSGAAKGSAAPLLVHSDSPAALAGDEPVLIALRAHCPVAVHPHRVTAAAELLRRHPEIDVLLSDDGLQHYALARDVEIVLFDERGVGNGWLLPAGPLREPTDRPRDFTVYNAAALPPDAPPGSIRMRLAGGRALQLADPSRSVRLAELAGHPRIAAAAGIGNPQRFFRMLRDAGMRPIELPLPDHYDYAGNPFDGIDAEFILITEKDAVKCRQHPALARDPRLWYVPVTAQLDGAFERRLLERLRGFPTP